MNGKRNLHELPCQVEQLVPQKPPMLLINKLLRRDRGIEEFAVTEATVPRKGVFVDPHQGIFPEYFIELVAQSIAAVNGYDVLVEGGKTKKGFLVGVDEFKWHDDVESGDVLRVEMEKDFEFGPVTVMRGRVIDNQGKLLAAGAIKVWEEK